MCQKDYLLKSHPLKFLTLLNDLPYRLKDEAEAEVEILKSEKAELNQFIQMANCEAQGLSVCIYYKEEKLKEI